MPGLPQSALSQFFRDDAGEFSCMRLVTALITLTVLGMWIWGCLKAGHYIPLGYAEAGIIGAAQGAKAAQARFEYGGAPPSPRELEDNRG